MHKLVINKSQVVLLRNRPSALDIHRMVRENRGTITLFHKHGVSTMKLRSIHSVDYEDPDAGAPWDYDDPLN